MATQTQKQNTKSIEIETKSETETKFEPRLEIKSETKSEPKSNEIYCTYCKNNKTDIFYNNTLKNYLCWSCQDDWQECEMAGEEYDRIEQIVADMKYDRLHPDID